MCNNFEINLLQKVIPFNISKIIEVWLPYSIKSLLTYFYYNKEYKLFYTVLNTNFNTYIHFYIGRDWYGNYIQFYTQSKESSDICRIYEDGSTRTIDAEIYGYKIIDDFELKSPIKKISNSLKTIPSDSLECLKVEFKDNPFDEKDIYYEYADYNPDKCIHILSTPIAGLSYYVKSSNELEYLHVGDYLTLKLEIDNIHDDNAISIWTNKREKLGYIPRGKLKLLKKIVENNINNIKCILIDRYCVKAYYYGKYNDSFLIAIYQYI